MNKQRLAKIREITSALSDLNDRLDDLVYQEDEAYNAMPESLQQSERGTRAEAALDALNEAKNSLDEAIAQLESIE